MKKFRPVQKMPYIAAKPITVTKYPSCSRQTASSAAPASAPPIATGERRLMEVVAGEVMMRLDLSGGEFGDDAPERDHVGAPGKLERERRLLFHQQDAEAAAVELAQGFENSGR